MANVLGLILLLVVMAGVIAYTGDWLGSLVGKRRLSLFGARPKQTGRMIGIFAGIVIMLMTVGTLALAFRNAVRVIFNAQVVGAELRQLEVQTGNLEDQLASLQRERDALSGELQEARDTIASAQAETTRAVAERDQARAELERLQAQRRALEANVGELEARVSDLGQQLTDADAELQQVQGQLEGAQARLAEAEAARNEASQAAADARAEVERLQAEVAEASDELAAVREALGSSQEALESTRSQLDEVEGQLAASQSELERAEAERAAAVTERDDALAQLGALQQSLTGLNEQVGSLQRRASELSSQNEALTATNDTLLEQNARLQTANESLQADIAEKNQQLNALAGEGERLRAQLEDMAQQLSEAEFRLAAIGSGDLTYSRNELVDSGVLSAQDTAGLRGELAQLLEHANEATARRRAGRVELTPAQLESLVAEALQTPGADIVTLRAAANHFGTEPVTVSVESVENRKLVGSGQLLISQQLHLGTPQVPAERERVRSALLRLQRAARERLLSLGLSDAVDPAIADTSLELDGFTNQLLRMSGPVVVGLSASSDIYSSGPAQLEFVIIN